LSLKKARFDVLFKLILENNFSNTKCVFQKNSKSSSY